MVAGETHPGLQSDPAHAIVVVDAAMWRPHHGDGSSHPPGSRSLPPEGQFIAIKMGLAPTGYVPLCLRFIRFNRQQSAPALHWPRSHVRECRNVVAGPHGFSDDACGFLESDPSDPFHRRLARRPGGRVRMPYCRGSGIQSRRASRDPWSSRGLKTWDFPCSPPASPFGHGSTRVSLIAGAQRPPPARGPVDLPVVR